MSKISYEISHEILGMDISYIIRLKISLRDEFLQNLI